MLITFYGVRGSIPSPGPTTVKYGGNTSCVRVEGRDGTVLAHICRASRKDLRDAVEAAVAGGRS